jgi:uncharacterized coiled-coil protein SlyX
VLIDGKLIKGAHMCDRCTALEIAVSEQRMMIDAKDAELARCREIIGDLQTRHAGSNREIQRLNNIITRARGILAEYEARVKAEAA